MKLWTIQPAAVVEAIERDGFAIAAPDFARDWSEPSGCAWGFEKAYGWMAERMASRLGPPPAGVKFPMWAWARPPSPTASGAPDRRSMRGEEPAFLLALEVPESDALLSDHGSWHMVLGGHCLGLTESDQEQLEARLASVAEKAGRPLDRHGMLGAEHYANPDILAELSSTWPRIFQIAPLVSGSLARMAFTDPADPQWVYVDDVLVQACLWAIKKDHVLSIVPIAPRPPARKKTKPG